MSLLSRLYDKNINLCCGRVQSFLTNFGAMLHLGLKNGEPELLGLDDLLGPTLPLVFGVEGLKFITPHLSKTWRLAWAEQAPFLVALNTVHEEIIDPEPIE